MVTDNVLSADELEELRAYVNRHGFTAATHRVGMHREVIARLMAGLPSRPGTIVLYRARRSSATGHDSAAS